MQHPNILPFPAARRRQAAPQTHLRAPVSTRREWLQPGIVTSLGSDIHAAIGYHITTRGHWRAHLKFWYLGKRIADIPFDERNQIDLRTSSGHIVTQLVTRLSDTGRPVATQVEIARVPLGIAQ